VGRGVGCVRCMGFRCGRWVRCLEGDHAVRCCLCCCDEQQGSRAAMRAAMRAAIAGLLPGYVEGVHTSCACTDSGW
jgi:hypothetical protein